MLLGTNGLTCLDGELDYVVADLDKIRTIEGLSGDISHSRHCVSIVVSVSTPLKDRTVVKRISMDY